jgi:hypothetical protein
MVRYLVAIAMLCLAGSASAQIPDTVFLERLTWDEVRDSKNLARTDDLIRQSITRRGETR